MANLWSFMNCPIPFKRSFRTTAAAPGPADGYSPPLTRAESDPTEGFSCASTSAPSQSAEAGSPPPAETLCSWISLSSSVQVTQQLFCKPQPYKGFHSQLAPLKNLVICSSPSNALTERRGSNIGRKPQACSKKKKKS